MILPYRGMQTAVACPKCRYVRRPADTAPAWQCPSCGIAYAKFQAKRLVVPPKADEAAPPIAFDGSIWLLLLVNCVALGISHWQKWPLLQLMLLYWAQSLAIGLSYVLRILSLDKYTTEGMKVLGQAVMPTPEARSMLAFLFVLSFGFAHGIYFLFLHVGASMIAKAPLRFDAWFWVCAAAFALNHLWSYRYNSELDRRGTPNAGTLMTTPFIRAVPMHLMVVSGAFLGGHVLLWGLLKTGADVALHLVEHAQLQKAGKAPGTI